MKRGADKSVRRWENDEKWSEGEWEGNVKKKRGRKDEKGERMNGTMILFWR